MNDLSRQRIDYSVGPRGEAVAILTVTLGDGSVHRYTARSTRAEVTELAAGIAREEMKRREEQGEFRGMTGEQRENIFFSIVESVQSVVGVRKKLASATAPPMAGEGLCQEAQRLGAYGPAAQAIGAGMAVAAKLSMAAIAAEAAANVAQALAVAAQRYAGTLTRDPSAFEKLVNWANEKRKAMGVLAEWVQA